MSATQKTPSHRMRMRKFPPSQPFLRHLRMRPLSAKDGKAEFEVVIRNVHLRTGGIIHGGVYATLMDAITGYAAHSFLPAGHELMTIQLNLNMTGTAKAGDRLTATAQTQHAGRTTAVAIGQIHRGDGKLVATGSATLLFVPSQRVDTGRPHRQRRTARASSKSSAKSLLS